MCRAAECFAGCKQKSSEDQTVPVGGGTQQRGVRTSQTPGGAISEDIQENNSKGCPRDF